MAPRPTKESPGSTTPRPPPRPDLPVQARHPPPPGLPATAPRPTAVVEHVAELMGGEYRTVPYLPMPAGAGYLSGSALRTASRAGARARIPADARCCRPGYMDQRFFRRLLRIGTVLRQGTA